MSKSTAAATTVRPHEPYFHDSAVKNPLVTCVNCGKAGRYGMGTHIKFCLMDRADLFWPKVKKGPGCWIWRGAKNEHGYGLVALDHKGRRRTYRAHRYSWELVNGDVPAGGQILHRCDVRDCVNPSHLFLGNNAINMGDKARKGRSSVALTHDQVREIKAALATGGVGAELARKYGVTPSTIGDIKRGKNYSYLALTPVAERGTR